MKKGFCCVTLLLLLTGCVHQEALQAVDNRANYQQRLSQLQAWELEGKLNVRIPGETNNPRISWSQTPQEYTIHLRSSLLGAGNTWIYGDASGVRIEQPGKETLYAATPEDLVYNALGYDIPVSDLQYWVRGIPSPDSPVQASHYTPEGVLERFAQSGWSLAYGNYGNVGDWVLPHRVRAERQGVSLTLVIKEWVIENQLVSGAESSKPLFQENQRSRLTQLP